MRVLFASGIDGFCHRYEVLHRAEQLRLVGGEATVVSFTDPRLRAEAARHDLIFLYRVPETSAVALAIDEARAAGVAVVGAIDDLVFVDDPTLFPEWTSRPGAERALWFEGLRRYRATLERCDRVIVPTAALLDEARAAGLPAVLHPNSVSRAELALGDAAAARADAACGLRRECFPDAADDAVVLGYFSGTPSHDRDFALAAGALAGVLAEFPGARLLLLGPVDPGAALRAFGLRVARRPLVPWTDLPVWIAACDAAIAPLEIDRRFAAAKGAIKYLDAAVAGVPTVATPSRAMRAAIRHRDNGMLAADGDGWQRALREIVADRPVRRRLGEAARADVEVRFAPAPRARELAVLLEDLRRDLARGATAPPARTGDSPWCVPAARTALEADAHPGALQAVAALRESPPLCGGHAIEQHFVARLDGLCRVDVHTVTYGLRSGGEIEVALRRGSGAPIARARVAVDELPDRAWFALDVPEQPDSAGARFTLVLALRGTPRDAVSFGLGDLEPGEDPARLDGAPLDGRLVLRAFAAWPAALGRDAFAVAEVAGRPSPGRVA